MFCSNCGGKIVEGKPFCIACGQAQPPVSASESVSPLPEEPRTPVEDSSRAEVAEGVAPLDPTVPPNPLLRADAQLGTVPMPEAGTVPNREGSDGGAPAYKSSTEPRWGEPTPSTQIEAKGFFASLFDFGFTSFITLKFLRVIYGVIVVLILLTSVAILVASISQGGTYAVLAIVVVPIVTLIYLVLTRVSLEIVALFFRIGENTSLMVAAANRAGPAGKP